MRPRRYYFESLDFPVPNRALDSYLAKFESSDAKRSRLHEHPGIEFQPRRIGAKRTKALVVTWERFDRRRVGSSHNRAVYALIGLKI
jgi:hypothetical protein